MNLSDGTDRARHSVTFVRAEVASGFAVFGRIREPINGVALQPGGVLYVRMATAAPQRTAFAIRMATEPQYHGKPQQWSVEIQGNEVCSATEVDPGAGAGRTAFVETDIPDREVVLRIRAGWRNAFAFVVTSVRAFALPADPGGPDDRGRDYRMGLALLTSQGFGYALDRVELERIKGLIPVGPHILPQASVLYNFNRKDVAEQMQLMRRFADLAYQARFPIRVAPQMHWAGIPAGVPDGAGGTFTDVPYQQITWDDDDQTDDPGLRPLLGDRYDVRYGLSVPNRWSNTPWLTFNHPRLNQYRRSRLKQCIAAWLLQRERLARWGVPQLFPGELGTGEETVYWAKGVDDSAYTAANGGKARTALLADFNPFVVTDALADRINLDPRNGLDRNERWWLHQNLARWQQTIVDWMLEALPPDPIRLSPGRVGMADDLVRRNVFTEPYAMPVFPMRGVNPLRPGLEVGYVRDGRSGGEYWSGATMLPWLIKERERGRIALPNLECTGADDGQLLACLRAAYAHGARYATLYNWHHRQNVRPLLEQFASSIATPASFGWAPKASSTPMPLAERAERTYVAGPDAFGTNTIWLHAAPSDRTTATVRVTVRSLDAKPELSVTVTAKLTGDDPALAGARVLRLPAMFHQKPGERYAVSVESVPPNSAICVPAEDGAPALTLGSDIRFERWRSMAVADYQDAADIIASVALRDREPFANEPSSEWLRTARRHLAAGRPRAAYAAAVKAEQLQFPCTFAVADPGADLVPFPIRVDCPDERVLVTVRGLTPQTASLTLSATARHRVTVRYRGSITAVELTPDMPVALDLDAKR
ncbi:MAG: hypothetical protein GX446_11680 [Chthonomonadales bacterium]|nr:hypothetical protein [Chthonomonadales bacterium]